MKILISVDIEGVAGVVYPEQTRAGNGEYERARQWMAAEADAAVKGAFAGGADAVVVADAHAHFCNMPADALDARARLVCGKPRADGMLGGLAAGVDAVVLVGYHSRAGGRGVLAHTINGFAFADIAVNGESVGEAALYGALAGERGVPVICASGDDVFIEENRARFPDAHFVETKQSLGQYSAVSLTPQAACARIHDAVRAAVREARSREMARLRFAMPCECVVRASKAALADLFAIVPGVERVDALHVRFSGDSADGLVRMLNTFSAMSASLR